MGSPFLQQTTIGKSNDKFNIEFLIYVKTGKKEMGQAFNVRNVDREEGDEMWEEVELLKLVWCSFGDEEGDSVSSLC